MKDGNYKLVLEKDTKRVLVEGANLAELISNSMKLDGHVRILDSTGYCVYDNEVEEWFGRREAV